MQCPSHSTTSGQPHPESCHYSNTEYAFSKLATPVSVRTMNSVEELAAAISLACGYERITIGSIRAALPPALWHRVEFTNSFKSENNLQGISDGPKLAEVLEREINARFEENRAQISRVQECLAKGEPVNPQNDDHPLFQYAALLQQSLRGN